MTLDRILVATDGSAHAARAVRFAAEQAARLDADLLAVFAARVPTPTLYTWDYFIEGETDWLQAVSEATRKQTQQVCDEAAARHEWSAVLAVSTVADAILDLADARDVDLIVVGQRGLGAIGRAFLGSTSNRIVSHTRRPVLVVSAEHGDDETPPATLGSMLIAADASDDSVRAAAVAAPLARANGARVTVANVVEPRAYEVVHVIEPRPFWRPEVAEAMDEIEKAQTRRAFQTMHSTLGDAGVDFEEVVLHGNPASAVLDYAKDHEIDLIVVGHRGLSGLQRFFMGSVSSRVLHHAPTNVLIGPVPEPTGD